MKWPNPRHHSSMSGKNEGNIQKKCQDSWHEGGQSLNEELPKYVAGVFTT